MNPIKDKHGVVIKEGDYIRYYDSTGMWLDGKVIDIGSCLAVETEENPIPLYTWPGLYPPYDGRPVEELEIFSRNIKVRDDGTLSVVEPHGWADPEAPRYSGEIVEGNLYAFIGGKVYLPERPPLTPFEVDDYPPLPKYRIEDAVAIERMEVPEEFKEEYTEAHGSIHTWDRRWPCYSHLEPYLNPESAMVCEICARPKIP